jgi:hypothetical protein
MMTDPDDDEIPVVDFYRGVGLHDQQIPDRLDVVRRAIDSVFDQHDFRRLLQIAGDHTWPPEARLFSAAKLEAMHQIAVDERKERPPIDLARVAAAVAGLNSQKWRDPDAFSSLLDPGPTPDKPRVKRAQPLAEKTSLKIAGFNVASWLRCSN